jgi:vancomycin resistance protein VanJ
VLATARRLPGALHQLVAAYPIAVAAICVVNAFAPQRGGAIALSQVFAPHLFLPVLALVPVALGWGPRGLRLGVGVALAIGIVRFGPGLVSIPAAPPLPEETIVRFLSWNLAGGASAAGGIVAELRETEVDVVALQELTPEHAATIRADPVLTARFPYMALEPRGGSDGVGMLSRYPMAEVTDQRNPALQVVGLELPDQRLTVMNAHAVAPRFRYEELPALPLGFDPAERDRDIQRIREAIDSELAAASRLVVVGDFNVTDREPGFSDLSDGLWDAHLDVGQGTGSTWRPNEIAFVPFGVLRIDYLLGGPGTRPIGIGQDCSAALSDHCLLTGTVAVS